MLLPLSNRACSSIQREWVRSACRRRLHQSSDGMVRVRFAPSPTGYLHLGGLRTALFNYLMAKKAGGQFILRIEDTDQARYVHGATEKLEAALAWAGIRPDEGPSQKGPFGPYVQSQRLDIYRQYANQLLENGHAYRCFCSTERLEYVRNLQRKRGKMIGYDGHCARLDEATIQRHLKEATPFTIRLRTPEGVTQIRDLLHGLITFENKLLDDQVLVKSNGYPTYHLANVVDDHLMQISHVLRGDEWLPSTPKHVILYNAFGWKAPEFAHLPLLLNPKGGKMSKRTGDAYVENYIEKGYFPEALNNFVALLGWHPENPEDELVFTMNDLIKKFDVKGLNKSQAAVDIQKLDWINKQHVLKRTETTQGIRELAKELMPKIQQKFSEKLQGTRQAYRLEPEYLEQVISCVRERVKLANDVPELFDYFFVEPDYEAEDTVAMRKKLNPQATELIFTEKTRNDLALMEPFDSKRINDYLDDLAKSHQLGYKAVATAARYGITGKPIGASIAHTMAVLGKTTCIERLRTAPL